MGQSILDKVIDKIFNMKKSTIYLIIIFALGFILRLIAAINLGVAADDMHHTLHAINFLKAGRLVTYDQSAGLWHAVTSVIYSIFGINQLSSRVPAILFGSFSIFLIFLFAREFFDEKISLISAFLLAVAPFHIKNTVAEMDVMTMFFVLLSMFLFIKALKLNKQLLFALSGVSLGLAIYTKIYPLLFIPSLLLYFVYYCKKNKKQIISKDSLKKVFIFLACIFIFALPTLTHNYLLYKDKGFLDLIFTKFTGMGKEVSAQYYSWDASFEQSNSWKGLFFGDKKLVPDGTPLLLAAISFVRIGDPFVFYLSLVGALLILILKRPFVYLFFFVISLIFILLFMASSVLLPKHYLYLEILMIPLAAFAFNEVNNKLAKIFKKNTLKILLLVFTILILIYLGLPNQMLMTQFYSKSNIAQMIDFKNSDIPKNALIVMDSRIYRGRINWVSQERPYLEGTDFLSIVNQQDKFPGNPIDIEIYYFECVTDDCGWGTVKNQPDFNASMESLTDLFKKNGKLIKTINEPPDSASYFPLSSEQKKIDLISIYKLKLQLKDSILTIANQPKSWFLYPIGYAPKEQIFDYYRPIGLFDILLDKLAHFVVLLAVILSFLSPIYIIYLFNKK